MSANKKNEIREAKGDRLQDMCTPEACCKIANEEALISRLDIWNGSRMRHPILGIFSNHIDNLQ